MEPADLIGTLASDNATVPDIRELLACIHNEFNGTAEYARIVVEDVQAAPPGSSQRLSFHNNYLSAIAKFGGNDDLPDDPQALEAEARRLINEHQEDNSES